MPTRVIPNVLLICCLSCVAHHNQRTTPNTPQNDIDEDGVLTSVDACPDNPEDIDGYKDEDGCPDCDYDIEWAFCIYQEGVHPNCPNATTNDHDGDGLFNIIDQCRELPEDKDGFQDQDGCPDVDNDDDCLFDEADECPNAPGPTLNKGCPHSIMKR
jgi:OmpA-OmpF porin, OOP family